ncbi:MAG TPA: pyridoxamine 5'-phosphate oxidase family protein [Pyrinomonadaceae bacterium]
MSRSECEEVLNRANVGRLACARDNQPYVVPINFAFDDPYLYGFTTLGQKVEWMRSNPLVCFEVDEVTNQSEWTSIVGFGRYEELPDQPDYAETRKRAYACLQKRVMWWEPAFVSPGHRHQPHSLTPIVYRIHIDILTGHRANSDDREVSKAAAADYSAVEITQSDNRAFRLTHLGTILMAAVVYFALVFGAGFLLALPRVSFAVPRLGERVSELLEAPLMLILIVLAANWIVRKFQVPSGITQRLGVGLIAFALGIAFEFTLVLKLRGLTLNEYFQRRDPVSGAVYYLTLVLFALMPILLGRRHHA